MAYFQNLKHEGMGKMRRLRTVLSSEGRRVHDQRELQSMDTRSSPLPSIRWGAVLLVSLAAVSLSLTALAAAKHTFTGEVGDAMCGRKHMEGEAAAECTRACVGHGSKFALIVGDQTYILDTSDKAALRTLDKQAGKMATVVGTLDGDTITVSSVAAK